MNTPSSGTIGFGFILTIAALIAICTYEIVLFNDINIQQNQKAQQANEFAQQLRLNNYTITQLTTTNNLQILSLNQTTFLQTAQQTNIKTIYQANIHFLIMANNSTIFYEWSP